MSPTSPRSPISSWGMLAWGLASLFYLYEFFLRTFIGSVAHQVIPDLHLNAETFAMVGSAYYVAYGIMQIPVGILADKYGVKLIMIVAALLCAVATFWFSHVHGLTGALCSRFLMGLGSSFAFVCLLMVVATWFPRKYFGFFSGASQFIGTMGPLLAGGPLVAMMASYHTTWRIMLTHIGLGGVALAFLIGVAVKNKPRANEKVLIFLKRKEPLSQCLHRLARNRQAWLIALYSGMTYMPMALLGAIWGTEYLQVRGISQVMAANMISLAWFGFAMGCPLLGAFSDIVKRRKPVLMFSAGIGFLSTALLLYLPLHQASWAYGVLLFGLGVAAAGQNTGFVAISEHVDVGTRATALGLNNGSITLFSAVFPPIISAFIFHSAASRSGSLQSGDFVAGFSIMPLFYILSFLMAALLIRETYCKPRKEVIKLRLE